MLAAAGGGRATQLAGGLGRTSCRSNVSGGPRDG